MTREQFIAQFPDRLRKEDMQVFIDMQPRPDNYEGVPIYRALQKLFIEVNGEYFTKWDEWDFQTR